MTAADMARLGKLGGMYFVLAASLNSEWVLQ
jgi:hypothetical protein